MIGNENNGAPRGTTIQQKPVTVGNENKGAHGGRRLDDVVRPGSSSWRWWAWLAAITLAGFIIRAAYFSAPPQSDETTAYLMYCHDSRQPLLDFISSYPLPNHHGLHGLAVALLYRLTGAAFPWIRLPTFLCGVAAIPLTFVAMRRWTGRWAALIAAAMMACSVWCIEYSVNARGYMMGTCWVLLAAWLLAEADRLGRRRLWIGAGILTGSAVYTTHTTVYFAMAVIGWLTWRIARADASRRSVAARASIAYTAAMGLTLLFLFGPIMAGGQFGNVLGNRFVESRAFAELVSQMPAHLRQCAEMATEGLFPAWPLWTIVCLGTLRALTGRAERRPLMIVAVLAVVPALLLAQRVLPPLRTLTYLLPFTYALAGMGIVGACSMMRRVSWRRDDSVLGDFGGKSEGRPSIEAGRRPDAVLGLALLGLIGVALGSLWASRPFYPMTRLCRHLEAWQAVDAAARSARPGDVIVAQSWVNPLIRYRMLELSKPPVRITRPKPGYDRAILVWSRFWSQEESVVAWLAPFRCERLLYDGDTAQVLRIARSRTPQTLQPGADGRLAGAGIERWLKARDIELAARPPEEPALGESMTLGPEPEPP